MVPPVPTTRSPGSNSPTSASSSVVRACAVSSSISSLAGGSPRRKRSERRREPRGRVQDRRPRRSLNSVSSMLPPPRSATTPRSTGSPWTAPRNVYSASSSPLITRTLTPLSASILARNSSAFSDSLTAEVATASMVPAPALSAMARKSRSAAAVRSMVSGAMRFPCRRSRARRRGARPLARISMWPGRPIRITTIRPELEPTSMTAIDRSATRRCPSGEGTSERFARSIGERVLERGALRSQDGSS